MADETQESGAEAQEQQQSDFTPTSLDSLVNAENPEGDPSKAETGQQDAKASDAETAKGDKQDEPPASDEKKPSDKDDKATDAKAEAKADTKSEDAKAKEDGKPEDSEVVGRVASAIRKDARQQLEQRDSHIATLEAKLAKLEEKPRPDEIDDPEGAAQWDRDQRQKDDDSRFTERVAMSIEIMQELHQDYDDMEAIFKEEAAKNPTLRQGLRQSPFPAKYAYQEGKRLSQIKEMGSDPQAYIEKVKKEAAEAAIAAVQEQLKQQGAQSAAASAPESLAEASSAKSGKKSDWDGPTPLGNLLNEKS